VLGEWCELGSTSPTTGHSTFSPLELCFPLHVLSTASSDHY